MKALVKYEKGDGGVKLMDVPVPEIGDDEVLVEVKATGVCGTDIHIYHGTYDTAVPLILGHEYSGAVVQTGALVSDWRVGDRVVMENNPRACGKCAACRRGSFNICPHKRAIGFKSDGCFASRIRAQASLLHRIPDGLSYEMAALSEPMAVAAHATYERGSLEKDDFVVVFGPGAIGIMCALVAKELGAARVVLVGIDRDAARMKIAESMGIDTINSEADTAWRERVNAADLIVDASGSPHAIRECLDLVSRAGRIVPVGITGQGSVPVPWDLLLTKETTISFSYSSKPANWEMALSILAHNQSRIDGLISARLSLDDWREGFSMTENAVGVKVLLQP